jgi:hypothetical protein
VLGTVEEIRRIPAGQWRGELGFLAGVFQIIIGEAGHRTREGQSQDQIADERRPAIEAVLDAWLTPAPPPISPGPEQALSKANHRQTALSTAHDHMGEYSRPGRS